MDRIYLDNNATTAMLPEVWEAMRPHCVEVAGNPASSHRDGQRARQALEDARERVAAQLGAFPDEVVFTSGATEANNLAIFGLVSSPPGHVVCSAVEHPCVLEPLSRLAEAGFRCSHLPVDKEGTVCGAEGLSSDTRLVAVMLANHETGTIQPVQALAGSCPETIPFHCDAAAAAGKMKIDFHELGVTSMTISAHKFHGPKGIGALLVRRKSKLRPQLLGGHQQQGRRPGTEPVALAVGLATALDVAMKELPARTAKVLALRQRFLDGLCTLEPFVLNGPRHGGIPHTLNISFPGCRADLLLMKLDLAGVSCSTGSACSSGSLLPSPVLKAMSVARDVLYSAMRFSLSHLLNEAEIDEALERIAYSVQALRR